MKMAVLIGTVTGFLAFISLRGCVGRCGALGSRLPCSITPGPGQLIGVAVVFGGVQTIEGLFLTPYLVGEKVGLGPVGVLLALMIGGNLFGFVGVLMAVPTAAALVVVIRRALAAYRSSLFYRARGRDRTGVVERGARATMRRIKVVLSDLHMGTGRLAADGTINVIEDFRSDQQLLDLLEYYRTGEYVDAEVEVILNGDIFECLALVDPDDHDPTLITLAKSLAKIDRILEGHKEVFAALRTFAAGERRQVTFMVGNHDQELLWDEVQARLKERIHPQIRVLIDAYLFDGVHPRAWKPARPLQIAIRARKMFLTKGLQEPVMNLPWGSDFFHYQPAASQNDASIRQSRASPSAWRSGGRFGTISAS